MIVRTFGAGLPPLIAECEKRQLHELIKAFQKLIDDNTLAGQTNYLKRIVARLKKFQRIHDKNLNNIKTQNPANEYANLCHYFINTYNDFIQAVGSALETQISPYKEEIKSALKFADLSQTSQNQHAVNLRTLATPLCMVFDALILNKQLSGTETDILTEYENGHTEVREYLIQKFIFFYSENHIREQCELVNSISDHSVTYNEEQLPEQLGTVIAFIKNNAEFFFLPLNDDDYFQSWAHINTNLLTPLSDILEICLSTPVQLTLFKNALAEYLNKSCDEKLIQFLNMPVFLWEKKNLTLALYNMIQSGELPKIIHKWTVDKNGECFKIFILKNRLNDEIQFLDKLITSMEITLDMDLSDTQHNQLSAIASYCTNRLQLIESNSKPESTHQIKPPRLLRIYERQHQQFNATMRDLASLIGMKSMPNEDTNNLDQLHENIMQKIQLRFLPTLVTITPDAAQLAKQATNLHLFSIHSPIRKQPVNNKQEITAKKSKEFSK